MAFALTMPEYTPLRRPYQWRPVSSGDTASWRGISAADLGRMLEASAYPDQAREDIDAGRTIVAWCTGSGALTFRRTPSAVDVEDTRRQTSMF